jgi:hypothetical protein
VNTQYIAATRHGCTRARPTRRCALDGPWLAIHTQHVGSGPAVCALDARGHTATAPRLLVLPSASPPAPHRQASAAAPTARPKSALVVLVPNLSAFLDHEPADRRGHPQWRRAQATAGRRAPERARSRAGAGGDNGRAAAEACSRERQRDRTHTREA